MTAIELRPGDFWKFPEEEYLRYCISVAPDESLTGIIGTHIPMCTIETPINSPVLCPQDYQVNVIRYNP